MANNPNNKANLKPFQKGDDERRNKDGRPKKLPELDELIADVLGDESSGESAAKQILTALYKKAVKGDIRAAEVLLNRGYGLPKQTVHNTGSMTVVTNYNLQPGNDPLPDD